MKMKMNRRRRNTVRSAQILLTSLAIVAGVAACGSSDDKSSETSGSSDGAFPVTVVHAEGTTVIPEEPQRIVALSFEEDALSAVGLKTVGHMDNSYDPGNPYPWQEGKVDFTDSDVVVGADGQLQFEKIAALEPDLILATARWDIADHYARLSEIAPTVGTIEGSWEDGAMAVGQAVGKAPEMSEAIAEVNQRITDLGEELPGLKGKTAVGVYNFEPGGYLVNTDLESPNNRLNAALGFVPDQELFAVVETIAKASPNASVSAERLDLFDADMLVISFGSEDARKATYADPRYANLPVVKDGRVYETDNFGAAASQNPTILNVPWQLDQTHDVLVKVANS
jgi:iron complex transport system substrate-binding protein